MPEEEEKRREILQPLLGTCSPMTGIEPDLHCDYGFNIHTHGPAVINYNGVLLDTSPVRIGAGAFIAPGSVSGLHRIVPADANSTQDNARMKRKKSDQCYHEFLWPDRYAECVPVETALERLKNQKNLRNSTTLSPNMAGQRTYQAVVAGRKGTEKRRLSERRGGRRDGANGWQKENFSESTCLQLKF